MGCDGGDGDILLESEIQISQLTASTIEHYAQCKEHTLAADSLSDNAVTSIFEFIPLTSEIHCADERSFELEDGQKVSLTYTRVVLPATSVPSLTIMECICFPLLGMGLKKPHCILRKCVQNSSIKIVGTL